MTIDRGELRKHHALTLSDSASGDSYWNALFKCARAVPALLDELDAKDRRIAELEAERDESDDACAQRGEEADKADKANAEAERAAGRYARAELQLSIATELNVADRKLIAELRAGLAEALDAWDAHAEDMGLEHASIRRLRALIPADTTTKTCEDE